MLVLELNLFVNAMSTIMCLLLFWLGHLLLVIEFVYLACYIAAYHFSTHALGYACRERADIAVTQENFSKQT